MKIKTKFPALISAAKAPGFKSPRPVLGLWEGVVEIAEMSETDVPVVLRVTEGGADDTLEFRHCNGRFYRSLQPSISDAEGFFERNCLSIYEIWKAFYVQARGAPSPDGVHPKGVISKILAGQDVSGYYDKLESIGRRRLSLEGESERQDARVSFEEVMAQVVFINGDIWIECGEPMLSVDRFAAYSAEVATNDLDRRDIVSGRIRNVPLGRYLYTMNELDEAFVPKINAPHYKDRTKVEVLDPSVFRDGVPIGYIISRLEDLSSHHNVPAEVKSRLIQYLADEANWSWDSAFDEIEYLKREVFPMKHDFMHQILEVEIQRIDARAIDFELNLGPTHGAPPSR